MSHNALMTRRSWILVFVIPLLLTVSPLVFADDVSHPLGAEDWQQIHQQIVGGPSPATSAVSATSGSAQQPSYLKASNTDAYDHFGWSVAISGDTAVIGAPDEDSDSIFGQANNSANLAGAVYVFVRDATGWHQQAFLKGSNTDAGDAFGRSVAISEDTLVVGAWYEDSNGEGLDSSPQDNSASLAGAAYVFVRIDGVWSEQAYLKASNAEAGDLFGHSVAISGDTLVVGAHREDSNATGVDGIQTNNAFKFSGAAYVFERSGTHWQQTAYLKASNTGPGDRFGYSVAISGDTLAVGAYAERSGADGVDGEQDDDTTWGAGAVYVFSRYAGQWSQEGYLKASNSAYYDHFGWAVAVSADTLVVGAPREDSNTTGVDGDQLDDSLTDAGAAYVFHRSNGVWSQQGYLKASNTGYEDFFGSSVTISGEALAVGAEREDSQATGVDGDQGDGGSAGSESGAVYVFERLAGAWSQRAYVKASNTDAHDALAANGLSIWQGTLVAGAINDDSDATEPGGFQGNVLPDGRDSGAVYVYEIP